LLLTESQSALPATQKISSNLLIGSGVLEIFFRSAQPPAGFLKAFLDEHERSFGDYLPQIIVEGVVIILF